MELKVVPVEYVPQIWDKVEGFLDKALQYSKGDYNIHHVQTYLAAGTWMLVIAEDAGLVKGAAAIQFFNRPTQRVAHIVAIGGRLVSSPETFSMLKIICKAHGGTTIEGAARNSIARLWAKFGFNEKYKIMEVAL